MTITSKKFNAGAILFVASIIFSQLGYAQTFSPTKNYRTWSVGIHGGAMSQANVFELGRDFEGLVYNAGYGAYIKKQLLPAFALQLEYVGGAVQGSQGPDQFQTIVSWSGNLSAQFTLANIN